MDKEVDGHEVAEWRIVRAVRGPGVDEDRDVVVPVQENQRLFAKDNEGRVPELH